LSSFSVLGTAGTSGTAGVSVLPVSTVSALGTSGTEGLVGATAVLGSTVTSSAKVEGAFTIENNALAQANVTKVFFVDIRKSPFSLFF
jgi:hypothetical protein